MPPRGVELFYEATSAFQAIERQLDGLLLGTGDAEGAVRLDAGVRIVGSKGVSTGCLARKLAHDRVVAGAEEAGQVAGPLVRKGARAQVPRQVHVLGHVDRSPRMVLLRKIFQHGAQGGPVPRVEPVELQRNIDAIEARQAVRHAVDRILVRQRAHQRGLVQ